MNQWKDALYDFGGYRPIVLNASFKGSLPKTVDVVVTAYSSFQKSQPPECLYERTWGRVILDEGHFIRNANGKTHKEIARLTSNIRWILSGTPIQNNERELYTLARYIGIEGEDIDAIVRTYVLRRTQDEMATSNPRMALPKLETKVMRIPFNTPEEEAFYSSVEEYFSERAIDNPTEAMTSLTRCRQACTNPKLYMTAVGLRDRTSGFGRSRSTSKKRSLKGAPTWTEDIGMTKTEYIVGDVVSHCAQEKCLIFCMWTEEMASLAKALKSKDVASLIYDGSLSRDNKEAALYNFKHTDIPVLILQINCGSTGLNLQCASRVYITSPHWNPCIELQAIGRAYRKGQTKVVTCVRVLIEGTVEERCMDIQEQKMHLITEAMRDKSLAARLGGLQKDLDEINVVDVFKQQKKKRRLVEEEEDDADPHAPKEDARDNAEVDMSADVIEAPNRAMNSAQPEVSMDPVTFLVPDPFEFPSSQVAPVTDNTEGPFELVENAPEIEDAGCYAMVQEHALPIPDTLLHMSESPRLIEDDEFMEFMNSLLEAST